MSAPTIPPAVTPGDAGQCTQFVPDIPRAPGLCANCGDSSRWHPQADETHLVEQRHMYLDLDSDSTHTVPGATCPNCPPGGAK